MAANSPPNEGGRSGEKCDSGTEQRVYNIALWFFLSEGNEGKANGNSIIHSKNSIIFMSVKSDDSSSIINLNHKTNPASERRVQP